MKTFSILNVVFLLAPVGLATGCVTTEQNIVETSGWEEARLSESKSIVLRAALGYPANVEKSKRPIRAIQNT
jgi:hypothetical protein